MNDLYKWINLVSKNFDFQPNEVVIIDGEYGGGVGRFVRLGVDGTTAIVDMKGQMSEFPLDNIDRAVAGEKNIYDEPETHRHSDYQADTDAEITSVDAHELNDKPELQPGDMVEITGAFGAGNGKGHGVFMGHSLDGLSSLVNIDSQVKSYPIELVSASCAVEDAKKFMSTGNDGALSPLSFGDQNKLDTKDETNGENNVIITISGGGCPEESEHIGAYNMKTENMGMGDLMKIVKRGIEDEAIAEGDSGSCCDDCKSGGCDGKCCDDCKNMKDISEGKECACESFDCENCFPLNVDSIVEKYNFEVDDDDDDDDDGDDDKDDDKDEEVDECNEGSAVTGMLTEGIIGGMIAIPDITNSSIECEGEEWYKSYMALAEGDNEVEDCVDLGDGVTASTEYDDDMDSIEYSSSSGAGEDVSGLIVALAAKREGEEGYVNHLMSLPTATIKKLYAKKFGRGDMNRGEDRDMGHKMGENTEGY